MSNLQQFEEKYDIRVIGKKERAKEAERLKNALKEVEAVNSDPNKTYKEKITPFSTLDDAEMSAHMGAKHDTGTDRLAARGFYTGSRVDVNRYDPHNEKKVQALLDRVATATDLPEAFDARDHGNLFKRVPFLLCKCIFLLDTDLVTPVKNQDECGSCYAFTAAAVHETALLMAGVDKEGLDLSEQFQLDCNKALGANGEIHNNGCDGGTPIRDLAMIIKLGGVSPTEEEWEYVMRREGDDAYVKACEEIMAKKDDWHNYGGQLVDAGWVTSKDTSVETLKYLIYTYGSAVVDVSATNWGYYDSGIMDKSFW